MSKLSNHGIAVDLPRGWEGSIHLREPVAGESTHPVMHAGTFPLPRGRGDYGSAAVDRMHGGDVFIALLEFAPDSVGSALFARKGLPTEMDANSFSPDTLQRTIPGQAGNQQFFNHAGRAFCLYVVLGAHRNRHQLIRLVNGFLPRISIGPA